MATSLDFVARGRPLRGQERLAPLAKRSTCSKSTLLVGYRIVYFWKRLPFLLTTSVKLKIHFWLPYSVLLLSCWKMVAIFLVAQVNCLSFTSGGSPPPPLIFRPNWGPKGRKIFLWRRSEASPVVAWGGGKGATLLPQFAASLSPPQTTQCGAWS